MILCYSFKIFFVFFDFREGLDRFYGIFYLWFSVLGVIIIVCVGLFVSWCIKGKGVYKYIVFIVVNICNLLINML